MKQKRLFSRKQEIETRYRPPRRRNRQFELIKKSMILDKTQINKKTALILEKEGNQFAIDTFYVYVDGRYEVMSIENQQEYDGMRLFFDELKLGLFFYKKSEIIKL